MEEPVRQIALNAGLEGSVIIDTIKRSGKTGYGFDAYNETYVDMIPAGIVDPTKVTRSALQNAASVAAMVLTTESLVADIPAPESVPAMPQAVGEWVIIRITSSYLNYICLKRRTDLCIMQRSVFFADFILFALLMSIRHS